MLFLIVIWKGALKAFNAHGGHLYAYVGTVAICNGTNIIEIQQNGLHARTSIHEFQLTWAECADVCFGRIQLAFNESNRETIPSKFVFCGYRIDGGVYIMIFTVTSQWKEEIKSGKNDRTDFSSI